MSDFPSQQQTGGLHTVTSQDQELVPVCKIVYLDIRESGHNLAFRRKLGAFLEFEIANRTGQGKVSVDTAEVNEPASRRNSVLLAYIKRVDMSESMSTVENHVRSQERAEHTLELRFVVLREGLGSPLDTNNTPGVTCIGLSQQLVCARAYLGVVADLPQPHTRRTGEVGIPDRASCRQ